MSFEGYIVFCIVWTVVVGGGYGAYCLYMMTNHPQEWAASQRRAHERRMQAQHLQAMQNMQQQEAEQMKAQARSHRNGALLGIGSVLLRAFLGR